MFRLKRPTDLIESILHKTKFKGDINACFSIDQNVVYFRNQCGFFVFEFSITGCRPADPTNNQTTSGRTTRARKCAMG